MKKTKELLKIAIPAVFESVVSVIICTIDTKMISVLGSDKISAVSFTTQPKILFLVIFFALGTTVTMYISQAYGSKDKEKANNIFILILKISIILSIVIGIFLFIYAEQVMSICSKQKSTLPSSVEFFKVIMLFIVFQTSSIILNAALRGIGNTKVTLVSNIAMGITDVVFNYLLIEGKFGFPALGVTGAAIATVIGTIIACVVSLYVLIFCSDFLSLKDFFKIHLLKSKKILSEVMGKASNIVVENIMMRIGFLYSSIIVSKMNSMETALYSVGMIIINYSFAFGDGLQNGVLALTGRSMGEKNYKALREYIFVGVKLGIISALSLGVIYITMSKSFFGFYFSDEWSIKNGNIVSKIVAIITFFQIMHIICLAALRGMGEVKIQRNITIFCTLIINPMLSYIFAILLGFRIWGVWIAMLISQTLWASLSVIFCKHYVNKLIKKEAI